MVGRDRYSAGYCFARADVFVRECKCTACCADRVTVSRRRCRGERCDAQAGSDNSTVIESVSRSCNRRRDNRDMRIQEPAITAAMLDWRDAVGAVILAE